MILSRLLNTAQVSYKSGRIKEAFSTYLKVLSHSPTNIDALIGAGLCTLALNRTSHSIEYFNKSLKLQANNIVALGSLGLAYQKLEKPTKAIYFFKKVLKHSPGNIAAHLNIALALLEAGNRRTAIKHCDTVIKYNPTFPPIYSIKGNAFTALGEFESAIKQYQKCLDLDETNIQSVIGLANCHIKLGDISKATKLIDEHKHTNHPELLVLFSKLATVNNREQYINQLVEVINTHELSPPQKIQLCFAAGKLLDENGKYDEAFKFFSIGNRNVKRNHSIKDDNNYTSSLISAHRESTRLLDSISNKTTEDGNNLIFIVGMPRTGTSLVDRILGSHTEIHAIGERATLPLIAQSISSDNNKPVPYLNIDTSSLSRYRSEYYNDINKHLINNTYVIDKLPHNFLFLGLISSLFPACKIIHCVRNKYDTCLSNYMQYFSSSLSYPYSLTNIANHYLNYKKLIAYWTETGIDTHIVRYEDIVSNPQKELVDLFTYLGIDYQKKCLKFHKSEHITRTASVEQTSKPLYTSSINKWKNYEKHLEPLFKVLGRPNN